MPYPLKSDLISELWAALQPIYNDTHEMGQNPSMITVDRVSIRAGHPGNNIKWAPSRNHAEQVTVTAPAAVKRSGYWGDKTWTFQVDTATATANIKGIVAAVGKALEALEAADVAKIEQAKLKLLAFTSERVNFAVGQEVCHQGDQGDMAFHGKA